MKQRTMSLRRVVGGGALLVLLVILALSVTGEIHTWAVLLAVGICNFAYGLESWWTARRRGKGPWWRLVHNGTGAVARWTHQLQHQSASPEGEYKLLCASRVRPGRPHSDTAQGQHADRRPCSR
jgi:hypothetical protein